LLNHITDSTTSQDRAPDYADSFFAVRASPGRAGI
jgi:hypothetical protein